MARVLTLISALAIMCAMPGCCRPLRVGSVPANLFVPQHTNTWCWAASTEMISDYYNHRVYQCDSSRYVHNKPASCSGGCPDFCKCWEDDNYSDRTGCGARIDQIKRNWTHWKFKYTYTGAELSWKNLKKSLSMRPFCDRSPVQIIWWWTLGGGHVVTAYGYAEAAQYKFVYYFNPWAPDCKQPDKACSSYSVSGGDDAVSTYEWVVSTADKRWGDTFAKFSYAGP
jgi:hypothetical protein